MRGFLREANEQYKEELREGTALLRSSRKEHIVPLLLVSLTLWYGVMLLAQPFLWLWKGPRWVWRQITRACLAFILWWTAKDWSED